MLRSLLLLLQEQARAAQRQHSRLLKRREFSTRNNFEKRRRNIELNGDQRCLPRESSISWCPFCFVVHFYTTKSCLNGVWFWRSNRKRLWSWLRIDDHFGRNARPIAITHWDERNCERWGGLNDSGRTVGRRADWFTTFIVLNRWHWSEATSSLHLPHFAIRLCRQTPFKVDYSRTNE